MQAVYIQIQKLIRNLVFAVVFDYRVCIWDIIQVHLQNVFAFAFLCTAKMKMKMQCPCAVLLTMSKEVWFSY